MPEALLNHIVDSTLVAPDRTCPVCCCSAATAKLLQNHIALHLERFSLFSLPRHVDTHDDSSGDGNSDKANAMEHDSRKHESLSDLNFEDDLGQFTARDPIDHVDKESENVDTQSSERNRKFGQEEDSKNSSERQSREAESKPVMIFRPTYARLHRDYFPHHIFKELDLPWEGDDVRLSDFLDLEFW